MLRLLALVGIVISIGPAGAAGTTPVAADPAFRVKPPDVGAGAAPGQIRRSVQAFESWTLVCDEDLKKHERICNVSQILQDATGQTAFSWSLAATRGGSPVMILRAPNGAGDGRAAQIRFRESEALIDVPLTRCDPTQCIGYLEVAPDFVAKVRKGVPVEVTLTREGRSRSLMAPTDGLAAALASLR